MADAHTLEAKWDGVDPVNQQAYRYRLVDLDREFEVGDEVDVHAQPPTASAFDQLVKSARVLTKRKTYRGQRLDLTEMVWMLMQRIDELEGKLDELRLVSPGG